MHHCLAFGKKNGKIISKSDTSGLVHQHLNVIYSFFFFCDIMCRAIQSGRITIYLGFGLYSEQLSKRFPSEIFTKLYISIMI